MHPVGKLITQKIVFLLIVHLEPLSLALLIISEQGYAVKQLRRILPPSNKAIDKCEEV